MSDEVSGVAEAATSTVILYEASGATTVHIEARVGSSGVTVAGHDLGKAPSEFFGESDYEYECTVAPADRDALLLAAAPSSPHYSGSPRFHLIADGLRSARI